MRGKIALGLLAIVAMSASVRVATADSFDLGVTGLSLSGVVADPGTFTVSSSTASMSLLDNTTTTSGPSLSGNFSMTIKLDSGIADIEALTYTYGATTTTYSPISGGTYAALPSDLSTAAMLFLMPAAGSSTPIDYVEIAASDAINNLDAGITVDVNYTSATPLPKSSYACGGLLISIAGFGLLGKRRGLAAVGLS